MIFMDKEYKFVKTNDPGTADLLREAGFPELAKEGDKWVFVNEPHKIEFSSNNMKMNFTDKLCF